MMEVEKILCNAFAEVLCIKNVDIDDNFFELGGDSVAAIQILSILEKQGIFFKIKDIFSCKTARALAKSISQSKQDKVDFHKYKDFDYISLYSEILKKRIGDLSLLKDVYPLSPIQSGFLFETISEPELNAYIVQNIIHCSKLSIEYFIKACKLLIEKNDILRSVICIDDKGDGICYILREIKNSIFYHDWSSFDENTRNRTLSLFIENDRKIGFDLFVGPLFRVNIIKFAEQHCVVIWSFHHILLDGWGFHNLLNDVFIVYSALLQKANIVTEKRKNYKDYIRWVQNNDKNNAVKFWKTYLSDITSSSFIPVNCKEKKREDFKNQQLHISNELMLKVKAFCRKYNLTLNTMYIGTVGIVLSKFLQQKEIIIGITTSGRSVQLQGAAGIIGLLINTVPVRVNTNYNTHTTAYLTNIQNDICNLEKYGYISLGEIQKIAKIDKLFNVLFVYENFPINKKLYSNVASIEKIEVLENTEYPLAIEAYDNDDNTSFIKFCYYGGNISDKIIEEMLECFECALEQLCYLGNFSHIDIVPKKRKEQNLSAYSKIMA